MGSIPALALRRGARSAFLAVTLSAAAIATAEPDYTLEYVGDTTPGVPSFGTPTLQEEGPAMGHPVAWDTANRRGLGCTETGLTKYALDDTDAPMPVPIGILDIPATERPLRSPVVDSTGGFAYYATSTTPARIVKIAFGAENDAPARVGTLTLEPGEDFVASAVIDEANGYAYFGTDSTPGRVVKVRLGNANEAPTRVGVLALDTGEDRLLCAVADPDAGRAYFGSATSGRIVTVDLGDGDALPTRLGALELGTEGVGMKVAAIDAARDTAYFGGGSNVVVKIATGGASALPTRAAVTTYDYEGLWTPFSRRWAEFGLNSILADPESASPYIGAGFTIIFNGWVHECLYNHCGLVWRTFRDPRALVDRIREGSNAMEQVGLTWRNPATDLARVHLWGLDPRSRQLYGDEGSRMRRFSASSRGALHGVPVHLSNAITPKEMRFYSHLADGNLRFGIYRKNSSSCTLLWQSGVVANTGSESDVVVSIADGTPALGALQAGSYLMAWQTDSPKAVGSFGDEYSDVLTYVSVHPFGPAPTNLTLSAETDVVGRWTLSLGYAPDGSPVPEIAVSLDGENVADDAETIDFGEVALGAEAPVRVFTVSNSGSATLTTSGLSVPTGFSVAEPLSYSIAPGASDTFTVAMPTQPAGTRSGTVTFVTNDTNENPFSLNVVGVVRQPSPEIAMSLDGDDIANGAGTVDFGEVAFGAQAPVRTFMVSNSGLGTLTTSGLTLPAGFSVSEPLASSIAPGESDTFSIAMSTQAAGARSGTVSFATNDADENPFSFNVIGVVLQPVPEIAVSLNRGDLPNGIGTVDFGTVALGAQAPMRTFTVSNSGPGTLTTSGLALPVGFWVGGFLASSIAPGEGDTFSIAMATGAIGTFAGEVSFATNDPDENPFSFNVIGVVQQPVPEIAVSLDGDDFANGAETVEFGGVELGVAAPTRTFAVANTGTGELATSGMVVPQGFSIVEPLSATIAPGAGDTFAIAMRTDADGAFAGDVTFATNDADENPFSFAVRGSVDGTFLDATGLDFDAIEPQAQGGAAIILSKSGDEVSCDFGALAVDAGGNASGIAQVALGSKAIVEVPVAGLLRYDARGDSGATTHRVRLKLAARGASADGEKVSLKLAGAREVETPSAVDPSAASRVDGTLAIAWGKRGKGAVEDAFDLGEPRVVRFVVPTGAFADERGRIAFAGDAPARVAGEDWSGGESVGTLRLADGDKPGAFRFTLENRGRTCRIDGTHPLAAIPADAAAFDRAADPQAQDFRANAVRATWKR